VDEREIGAMERIGRRELKQELPKVFARTVQRGRSAALTNQGAVEAVLMAPDTFAALRELELEVERLRASIPLLVAAARSRVAIPSQSLEALGLDLELDWRAVNAFAARFAPPITHDEEGGPLAELPDAAPTPVTESDEELRLG
jgi:PHD/YefM family antitoxin component YafN of YafNO toxin-antitoxin module